MSTYLGMVIDTSFKWVFPSQDRLARFSVDVVAAAQAHVISGVISSVGGGGGGTLACSPSSGR